MTGRHPLFYNLAHPEAVSVADVRDAVAALTGPVALTVDPGLALPVRAPLSTAAATRDFGFEPKIGHREGIRRMIEAAGGSTRR